MLDSLTMTSAVTAGTTMFGEFSTMVYSVIGISLAFIGGRLAYRLVRKGAR